MAAPRFLSLDAIREFHNALLDERADVADDQWNDDFLARIDVFMREITEAGAVLEGYDKRSGAQRILDYWIDQTFRKRRSRDSMRPMLAPFDAALAVAAEDLPDDAFPFREFGESPDGPEDLLPSRHKAAADCVDQLNDEGLALLVGPRASGRSGVALAGVVPLWLRRATGEAPPADGAERRVVWYDRPRDVQWTPPGAVDTLVVIDHVEDVFDRNENNSGAWLEQLGRALDESSGNSQSGAGPRRRILLIVRRDSLHHLEASPIIGSRVVNCTTVIQPLEARELTEVIESRAKQIRLWFARGLVDQIVSDILGDPGALPWLRVALRGLWDLRARNRINWSAYDQLGGARLLERGLEAYYDQSPPQERDRVERLLKRLVLPGLREEDFQCVRVAEADLIAHESDAKDRMDPVDQAAAVRATIDALIARGLLSRSDPGRGASEPHAPMFAPSSEARPSDSSSAPHKSPRGPTIRVVHESFVPRWRRLMQWLAAQRDLLEDLLRLVDAATAWRDSNQNVGALWIDQTLINDAIKSLSRVNDIERAALPGVTVEKLTLAREFLARSQQNVNWRETLRRLRMAVATAAACVFGGLWLLSEHYRGRALTEQQEAERALGRAHRAERERILSEDDLSGALELLNDTTRHNLTHDERQPAVEEASSGLLRRQLLSPSYSRLIQARGPYQPGSKAPRDRASHDSHEPDEYGAWVASTLSANGSVLVECYERRLTVHRMSRTGPNDSRTLVPPTGPNGAPTAAEFRSAVVSADGKSIVAEVVERIEENSAESGGAAVTLRAAYVWHDAFAESSSDRVEAVRLRMAGFESLQVATVRTEYAATRATNQTADQTAVSTISTSVSSSGSEDGPQATALGAEGAWLLAVCPPPARNVEASNSRELQIWQLNATSESPEPRLVASQVIDLRSQEQIVTSSLLRFAPSVGANRFRVALALRDPGAGPVPLEVRIWDIVSDSQSGELSRPFSLATSCTNITNLSWSPVNQRFLAITGNRAGDLVELWRVDCADDAEEDGAVTRPLAGPQRVQSFADSRVLSFSGDGTTFVTGAKDAAFLWRLERSAETGQITPRFLFRLPHEADVFAASFAPDGRRVATGSRDRTARLWNVDNGQRIGASLRHTEVVTALAFDQDAKALVTLDANFSSGDRTARIWPLESGNPPPQLVVTAGGDALPALSPDGRSVVRFREYSPLGGESSPLGGSPRLERLAAAGVGRSSSSDREMPAKSLPLGRARAARFSADGGFVLTWQDPTTDSMDRNGDMLWEFRVHDTRDAASSRHAVVSLPRIPGPGPWRWAEAVAPSAMAISNRGDRVAVAFSHGAGLTDRDSQGVIWVWSRDERPTNSAADHGQWDSWTAWRATAADDAMLHRSPIVSMAFSPNGDKLATASTDDTVCLWSSAEGRHEERGALERLRHGADVNDVRFVNVGRGPRSCLLVTASSDGKLRIWPCESRGVAESRVREFSHRAPIQFGMLNHDGTLAISAGDDGRVKVWNAASGELTAVLQPGRYVRDLAVARDGTIWTVSQTPSRPFPPPTPVFPTGWKPAGDGVSLLPPVAIQAWRARSAADATRDAMHNATIATHDATIATLLAARRFARNGQLIDMTPTEYAEQWRIVRDALGHESQERGLNRDQVASYVAECISRRDWYAARWQLDQWLTGADAESAPASFVAAKILRAHVQASVAAEQFDGQQACREFDVALKTYEDVLQDRRLSSLNRSELWLRLGWLNEKLGNWDDALASYTAAINEAKSAGIKEPDKLAPWFRRRGMCYAEVNDFAQAAADFEQSSQLVRSDYRNSYDQLYCLALLALHAGQPNNPDELAAYARGCAQLIAGHRQESARSAPGRSWEPAKESASANTVAALCSLASSPPVNPDDAVALARRAVELAPDDYYAQSTLGGCRFRQAMRLGPLRSALVQARADLMAARQKYMARRQTQSGADTSGGGAIQDDGTPYDWLFLAMVTWQLAELDANDPKSQRKPVAPESLRKEAQFWLEKARQQLDVPASLPRASGRLPCAPATGWSWWQRLELNLLLREAETMLGQAPSSRSPTPAQPSPAARGNAPIPTGAERSTRN